jgi:hypothetical protein
MTILLKMYNRIIGNLEDAYNLTLDRQGNLYVADTFDSHNYYVRF